MIDRNDDLAVAIEAAKKAGEILKENFGKKYRIIRKSYHEMVTEIDMKAQKIILKILSEHDSSCGIITEEKAPFDVDKRKNWIVDPLDGTHNYIAGLPFSGISIGLADGHDFLLGVIYFPLEEELYYSVKGEGAYLNGKAISASQNDSLSKSIICFDNQFHLNNKSFEYYRILTERAFTTRIFGTATMDLCLIASGKIDGRIWVNTKICDIAAGLVILSEAGGKITNFDGTPCDLNSHQVIASNNKIHHELLKIIEEIDR